jgi:hypothetical protein
MNKKSFLIGYLFFLITPVITQAQSEIRGSLVDENAEAVAFAHIYINTQTNMGAISNLNGDFILKNVQPNDSIIISHLGYEVLQMCIADFPTKDTVVLVLQQKMYMLQEVLVTPDNIQEIIKAALSKIADNYPHHYAVSQGIMRKQILKGDEYVFFGACTMDIAISSLEEIGKTRQWGLQQRISDIRVSEDKLFNDKAWLSINPSAMLFLYPLLQSLYSINADLYDWKIEKIFEKSGELIYKINYTGKNIPSKPLNQFEHGTVYISGEDKAIIALIYTNKTMPVKEKAPFGMGSLEMDEGYITTSVFYEQIDGKWQFSYGRADWSSTLSLHKKKTPKAKNDITMSIDFFVQNRLDIENQKGFSKKITDPFINNKKYTKTQMSEFSIILPDYDSTR